MAMLGAAALCGCGQQLHTQGAGTRVATASSASTAVRFDAWKIRINEQPSRIAQLTITLMSIAHIEQGQTSGRIVTWLLVRNGGRSPVRMALGPTSTFIGDRRLLVATPDCGYAQPGPGGSAKPGVCAAILRVLPEVDPGRSLRLPVTAYAGLPGMSPLAAGSYSVPLPLSIASGATTLTLTYDVTRSSTS